MHPQRGLWAGKKTGRDRYKVQGLTKATTYYYRVVAENEDGISYGDEVSFKTRL